MSEETPSALTVALRKAEAVVVFTGAGMSADSGVPTFRGADGLWKGRSPEELATPFAFHQDPGKVWEFYDWRRSVLAACLPNAGHTALVRLEQLVPEFTLITQNVDGLHAAAGSRDVLEVHGNIWRLRCSGGCPEREDRRAPLPRPLPPVCRCKSVLRPAVVWFGEPLPREAFERAENAARLADVMIVVGSSGAVEPAASLVRTARSAGAVIADVNPEDSLFSAMAHHRIRANAAVALPRLVSALEAAA